MDRVKAIFFFLVPLVLFFSKQGLAQRVVTYDFSNDLVSSNDSAPPLRTLGLAGEFVKEVLPELGDSKRPVYQFQANSGLQFNNKEAFGLLNGSYTVEIYFRLNELDSWKRVMDFKNRKSDNGCYIYEGKLNFFNFATGEKAPVKPNEYVHYVFSKDVETHVIKMYVDGESKVEFVDPGDEATLDQDQVLNFFQDDLIVGKEASIGAVALIRLYDRVMTPVFVRQSFKNLARTIQNPPSVAPKKAEPEEIVSNKVEVAPPIPPGVVEVTGKVFNGKSLDFLDEADVLVRRVNSDTVVARTKTVQGAYKVEVPASATYRITATGAGFQPRSIVVTPGKGQSTLKTLHNMEEESYDKPIFIIPFVQSEYSLTEDAKAILDSVVAYMKDRPDVLIKLYGHTDNVGEFDKNILLSGQRNVIAQDYLLRKGVDTARIEMKGFGPSRPRVSNTNETTRHLNRRVEVWAEPIKR